MSVCLGNLGFPSLSHPRRNQPIEAGGFWDEATGQYAYWRDKDGSVHGRNLVPPIQFAAVAYGLCDDPARVQRVLANIEARTAKENLFHWPLCFDSYAKDEVHRNNWPFPTYEARGSLSLFCCRTKTLQGKITDRNGGQVNTEDIRIVIRRGGEEKDIRRRERERHKLIYSLIGYVRLRRERRRKKSMCPFDSYL